MRLLYCLIVIAMFSSIVQAADKPHLIVLMSYDQLRGDRLSMFRENLSEKGFKRVMSEGVVFDSCMYRHAVNMTAPGHSVMLTGTDPYKSGIVGNEFIDRSKGQQIYATQDTGEVLSARNLLTPTIGDLLKASSPSSKVIGISIKDRPAILMTGQKADYALWLEPSSAGFATSAAYAKPTWLDAFNQSHDLSRFAGETWNPIVPKPKMIDPRELEARLKSEPMKDPSTLTPPITESERISMNDDVPWEGKFPGGAKSFPHTIPNYGSKDFWEGFIATPFAINWTMDAVKTCVQKEKLGKRGVTDVLCVGISTTDEIGHVFGPNSREMKEIIISCDRSLEAFIDFLDDEVGRENYELIITADHGVAEVPENLAVNGMAGYGRISQKEIKENLMQPFLRFAPVAIESDAQPSASPGFVKHFLPPFLFLDSAVVTPIAGTFQASCDTLCKVLRATRGIGIALTTASILAGNCPSDMDTATFNLIRRSVYAPRSGDIVFFPKRGWLIGSKTTTHGTPYEYDRYVPLMFFGAGLHQKRVVDGVGPEDIAPTLAKQLKLHLPKCDGSALQID